MAIVAADLAQLLRIKQDIAFYTQQQIYWANKYEANTAKLSEQVSLETKWQEAFDDAIDPTKDLTAGNIFVPSGNQCEILADDYAHEKVDRYDENLSEELAALDVDYETQKTVVETLLQELRAEEEQLEQLLGQDAQDTGIVGGG